MAVVLVNAAIYWQVLRRRGRPDCPR